MAGEQENSFLFNMNTLFIEEMYCKYLADPTSVPAEWVNYFSSFPKEKEENDKIVKGPSWSKKTSQIIGTENNEENNFAKKPTTPNTSTEPVAAYLLMQEFRINGHLAADLDPLGLEKKLSLEDYRLDPQFYGLSNAELEKIFNLKVGNIDYKDKKLSEIINYLKKTYCSTVGYEFSHIHSLNEKEWLFSEAESIERKRLSFTKEEKIHYLKEMVEIEGMEQFLHSRFPGAKRFSVEGGESSVLATNEIINVAAQAKVQEVIIGMAHRGRLNTLTKIMKKPYVELFAEFRGLATMGSDVNVSGDVKYHSGRSTDINLHGHKLHLSLVPNPSHLEAVNPVAQGKTRAKQDVIGDKDRTKVISILIHGDAAFSGQGVVPESLTLGVLDGYKTGGMIHIVVNNQIGFTVPPHKGRLSRYPTEVAKTIQAPIIHVNGNDVEAVILVTRMAESYRQKFKKDIILDIVCYRKYGHNEGDEPMFTQPLMYKKIKTMKSPPELYAEKLISENILTTADYEKIKADFLSLLEKEYKESEHPKETKAEWLKELWNGIKPGERNEVKIIKTGVDKEKLKRIGLNLCNIPQNFQINNKIKKLLENRKETIDSEKNIDWATAEALAYGSLLAENIPIRISGQDACRGTFSHRHSVLIDQDSEANYIPLNNIADKQANFEVIDSNLSEYAVLGFEYGYSMVNPMSLTIWEAQFGDFSNGAQIIIDQFISAAEEKWLRMSGLVMLLPHGFEGQGPEHSSARLERYLQLCAENNMEVVNCTTPANFFHVIRRQIHREYRVPLIVMSPKSLLRHKLMISNLNDFETGKGFLPIIGESTKLDKVKRVILCSGKVYFDLLEAREEKGIKDIALIRLEQYYPFPSHLLIKELKQYKDAEFVWCQEEPRNMGAWKYLSHSFEKVLIDIDAKNTRPLYIGRDKRASPATGYARIHNQEQNTLINTALNI